MDAQWEAGRMNKHKIAHLVLVSVVVVLFLAGCGGMSNDESGMMPIPAVAPSGPTLRLSVGDMPADQVAAFDATIEQVELTTADGRKVDLANGPFKLEFTHAAGTVQPVVIANIPAGTYDGVTLRLADANVTTMDGATRQMIRRPVELSSNAITLQFAPTSLGNTPMAMNCILNGAASLRFDAAGNASMTPRFSVQLESMAGMDSQVPEDGAIEDMPGFVTAVTGSAFTMATAHMTQSLTFSTDSLTTFAGLAGISGLRPGMMVEVEAVTASEGTLLARKIELMMDMDSGMMNQGMQARGIVSIVTGDPATQVTLVMHRGMSPGAMMEHGQRGNLTASFDASTRFTFERDRVDLTGLPFTPAFDARSLAPGQVIEVGSSQGMDTMMDSYRITAKVVELERQALAGTVSGYSASGSRARFTLLLATDSFFASSSGFTRVDVYQQPNTELRGVNSLGDGVPVRVRGLLFFDGTGYQLVAWRIMPRD
jgi:hypothetical protein